MKKDMEVLLAIVAFSFIISIVSLTLLGLKNLIAPFLGLSLSDSINPCTFVIYTMLLIALSVKEVSKRRIYAVGLAFVAAIYISYYVLGVGLVVFSTSIPTWVAGILAIIFGLYTMITGYMERSRIAGKKEARRKIFSKDATIIGAFTLGIIVSFTLLPCSAGSYLIYAILISKVGGLVYVLLALYNLLFILPLIIILFVMGSISESKSVSQKLVQRSRELSMFAGAILIAIGLWVLYAY
ncbi:cytochrome c biogenesis protein CcdA [Palaeococcus sp. (in: euryarchaeotes)]